MNCQYCGKKIGIIENWRYGRFCSREHQEEFREEASRLAASVLGNRPAKAEAWLEKAVPGFNLLNRPMSDAGEVVTETEPQVMGVFGQQDAAPVQWKPEPAPANPESHNRASNGQHARCLRLLAAKGRTPPPVLEKDRRRRLNIEDEPYRFGEVVAPGARSVLLPPSGAVQKRPKLRFWDLLLPLDQVQEIQAALPEFEWAWEGGFAWDAVAAGPGRVNFGDYLGDYSPEPPWEHWDWDALFEQAKHALAMKEERDRQFGRIRPQQQTPPPQTPPVPATAKGGQPGAGLPAMPTYPGRTQPAQQVGPAQRAMPALNVAQAGTVGGANVGYAQPAGRPRVAVQHGQSMAPGSQLLGGIALPAMPTYPGRMVLRPAGGAGTGSPQKGSAQRVAVPRPGPLVRIVPAIGMPPVAMEWVELAPPLFLALCRIDDPEPSAMPWESKKLPASSIDARSAEGPVAPGFAGAIAPVRMSEECGELEMLAMPRMLEPPPFTWMDSRPSPMDEEHARTSPVHRTAPNRFRIPPMTAPDWGFVNLRPLEKFAKPEPGMSLDGSRRLIG